jgi:glycosyltransferase involved in cell wall biosynthesis
VTVAVVIPAKDEAERIAETVAAARALGEVVVVDDGSRDGTAAAAERAGARVVRHDRNRGKGAAMTSGAGAVPEADVLVFLDADLGATAAEGAKLVAAVERGTDCAIALLPRVEGAGGHGFVVRLARDGIARATGFAAAQPLSGQRALTREAFEKALPLARGFGVEAAMTIDLVRNGYTIVEVETAMSHRVTGNGWRHRLHRARQYRDVRRALRSRRTSPAPE